MQPPFASSCPPSLPSQTLTEVNAALGALDLPVLTRAQRQALIATEPSGRVLRALRLAQQGDQGSLAYLRRVLAAATTSPPVLPAGATNVVPWPGAAGAAPVSRPHPGDPSPVVQAEDPPPPLVAPARPETRRAADPERPAKGAPPAAARPATAEGRRNIHVYGGKAALTFEPAVTRGGAATIVLDAATATGTRQYDWEKKIRVQWSLDELPVVLAVLLGWLPRCEFSGHGEQHEKGFSLENQPDKGTVFVRVFAKDQGVRAVPMAPGTACRVAGRVLAQVQAGFPGMTATEVLTLVKHTVVRLTPALGGK